MSKAIVVKIGGSTLGQHDTSLADLAALQREGWSPVVVHGGGKTITRWLERQALPTRFVRGLRVTDAATLEIVVAVLAGLVNKELVASLNLLGSRAVGLCGADGGCIRARVKDPELGLVGEVTRIDTALIRALTTQGFLPVIAPIALTEGSPSEASGLLNINADTVAGELAEALGARRLVFLTDVPGVCNTTGAVIRRLNAAEAQQLIDSGVAGGGMVPKLEACLRAARSGALAQVLDGRTAHALHNALGPDPPGTLIS